MHMDWATRLGFDPQTAGKASVSSMPSKLAEDEVVVHGPLPPSPDEVCCEFIQRGDVTGLVGYLSSRTLYGERIPLDCLQRCVRVKASQDLDGLSDDVFAAILSLGLNLLARVQVAIERRLHWVDEVSRSEFHAVPQELIKEGLLEQAERLSRFCAEMAALRARVRHLSQIEKPDARRKSSKPPGSGDALEPRAGEAEARPSKPGAGRRRARTPPAEPRERVRRAVSRAG
jgi:hypothetical protein